MDIFDNLEQHIQNPLVLQSILSLMERGTLVLTTNYDNLLEIFGQQQNKPMESLDLKDKTKVGPWVQVGGGQQGRGVSVGAAEEVGALGRGSLGGARPVMALPHRALDLGLRGPRGPPASASYIAWCYGQAQQKTFHS